MGIEQVLERLCSDVCVYWGSPVDDGYGSFTFAEPIEISCLWNDLSQIVFDTQGEELASRALVYVTQDVDELSMLFHGTLDDLYDKYDTESSGGALPHPKNIDKAYFVKRFEKTPALGSRGYLRKAFLTLRYGKQ
jgi:hypothetical protein